METLKKYVAVALVAILAVGVVSEIPSRLPRAEAQAASSSGHDERTATISASVSSSASVITAISGKKIAVKGMVLRSSGAGVMVFTDGDGGTALCKIYLEADKSFTVDELVLGGGLKTTAGNGLYAVLSGATLTATFRYWAQ